MEPPPPPPSFQSASSLLKTSQPSTSSNRNASGGLPPIPKLPPPAPVTPVPGPGPSTDTTPASSKPINRPAASKNAIVYSSVQRRNPVLSSIKQVGIEIGDIVADYQVGAHNGVLFLSLKYHRLHPEYIHQRIEKMKNVYNVRIVLVLCDITEHQQSLREISKIAIINDLTVLVAWSNEEAAQYLVTLKNYEHKSADILKERVHQSYPNQLEHVLTSGKKVNKSDTEALAASFGSFANITRQSNHALGNVKGLGPVKVISLLDAFNKPFLVGGIRSAGTGPPAVAAASISVTSRNADSSNMELAANEDEPLSTAAVSGRARERAPSRSPEPRVNGAIWHDPLDDDEDEGSSKRPRLE